MEPARFIEDNIKDIDAVIRSICISHGISGEDAKDFASHIKLQLIEDDYRKIRAFTGRSSFKTYLHTLITRISIDWRRREKGRWRPSEEARKMGQTAVLLEEMIVRDNHTFDEAYEILTTNHNISIGRDKAYDISLRLPEKSVRGMKIDTGDDNLSVMHDPRSRPDKALGDKEFEAKKTKLLEIVDEIRDSLLSEDRLLLRMAFEDDFKISEIARALRKDRSYIDRRIKSVLQKFKESILQRGININDAAEIIRLTNESGEDNG